MRHENISPTTAQGLKVLKERIAAANIPPSKLDETVNIATWNIREFGRKRNDRFRSDAAIHYVAEILGQFDLISIVELRDNLTDLRRVMEVLGPYWKALFSDYNPDAQGNRERIAFLYDSRAVVPTGLAAEADPPRTLDPQTGEYRPAVTWWRSPYMGSFRAGSFDFVLLSVHVRWGPSEEVRLRELELLADWVERRVKDSGVDDQDYILTGDFNIPSTDGPLFRAVSKRGLEIPDPLRGAGFGTNLAKNKRYDQILHYRRHTSMPNSKGGVLDFFADDWESLFPSAEFPSMSAQEFTYQLSDHLPLWIQLQTDVEGERLDQILAAGRSLLAPAGILGGS